MENNKNGNQNQNQTSWNFNIETKNNIIENFDTSPPQLEEKLKKILNKKRRKMENPKKIPELENILDVNSSLIDSPSTTSFEFKSKLEPFSIIDDTRGDNRIFYDPNMKTDSLFTLFSSSNGEPTDTKDISNSIKIKSKKFGIMLEATLNKAKEYITYGFNLTIGNVLKADKVMRRFVEEISNGATNGKASYDEKVVFYKQIKTFIMVLLAWVIVYNWYYVAFFLKWNDGNDDSPGVKQKYTFESPTYPGENITKEYGSFAYAMVGPCVEIIYVINKLICKTIPNKIESLFPTGFSFKNIIIFVILAFVIMSFIEFGVFSGWISDYFTSLKGDVPMEGVVFIVAAIISLYTASSIYFSIVPITEIRSIVIGVICFILWILYMLYVFFVLTPLGVVLLLTYLIAYTFFAVFIYNGLNVRDVFNTVSTYIASIDPDTSAEYNDEEETIFETMKKYSIKIMRYLYVYLFEILLIYSLVSGIYLYVYKYLNGETSTDLFGYLIVYNILIIVVVLISVYWKFNNLDNPTVDAALAAAHPTIASPLTNSNRSQTKGAGSAVPLTNPATNPAAPLINPTTTTIPDATAIPDAPLTNPAIPAIPASPIPAAPIPATPAPIPATPVPIPAAPVPIPATIPAAPIAIPAAPIVIPAATNIIAPIT